MVIYGYVWQMDSKQIYTTVYSYEQGLLPWCEIVEDAYSSLIMAAEQGAPWPGDVPLDWWDNEMLAFRGRDDRQSDSKE